MIFMYNQGLYCQKFILGYIAKMRPSDYNEHEKQKEKLEIDTQKKQ